MALTSTKIKRTVHNRQAYALISQLDPADQRLVLEAIRLRQTHPQRHWIYHVQRPATPQQYLLLALALVGYYGAFTLIILLLAHIARLPEPLIAVGLCFIGVMAMRTINTTLKNLEDYQRAYSNLIQTFHVHNENLSLLYPQG